MTIDRVKQAYAIDPSGKLGKQFEEQLKMEQEAIKLQRGQVISTPDGPFNLDTKQYLPLDPYLDKPIEMPVPYVGNQKITQRMAKELEALDAKYPNAGPDREDAFAQYYARRGVGEVTYQPPVAGKPAVVGGMKTSGQLETERKGEQKTQDIRITKSEDRASALIDRGQAADTTKNIALDMAAYAESNPRVFQLMQTASLKDAVLRSAEKMGAPLNIDPRIVLQYKLDNKDIEALQMFAQKSAQLTVELRKSSRVPGEGATSDSEGKLYSQVEALPTDTARVIGLKSELLALRTDYDKAAATLWVDWSADNPGKSFDKFRLSSPEFKKLRNSYDSTLEAVRKANTDLLRTAPSASGQTPATGNTPSADNRGNQRVIGGFIWERDEKGGWNNTGRKAQ
jgi:hypothetical protein